VVISIYETAMAAGEAAMRRGNFHSAVAHFEDALTEDVSSAIAHAELSLCLSRLNRRYGADEEAKRAISLDPELPAAHIALGYAALAMGDEASARNAVVTVKGFDPDDINAHELACSIALYERKAFDLQKAAKDLLAREPESPVGKYMLSRACSMLGRGKEAEMLARESLREAPEDEMGHEAIGWAFLAQGKHREAKQAAYNALQLAPTEETGRVLLAAATLRSRPLTGWMFVGALWMMRNSERAFITFALVFMAVTSLAANILRRYGQDAAIDVINIASWVLAIIFVGSVLILNQIINREAKGVRLSRDY